MNRFYFSWANCLKDSVKHSSPSLDHTKFLNNPGRIYTAKKQCEILLRDVDALVSPNQKLDTICYNLQCKTPHKSGFYFAGPALDGTQCGNGKVTKCPIMHRTLHSLLVVVFIIQLYSLPLNAFLALILIFCHHTPFQIVFDLLLPSYIWSSNFLLLHHLLIAINFVFSIVMVESVLKKHLCLYQKFQVVGVHG